MKRKKEVGPTTEEGLTLVTKPAPGSRVSVTIDNFKPNMLFRQDLTLTYIGTVVQNFPWCDLNDMCMVSDDNPTFTRRIKMSRVLDVKPLGTGEVKVTVEKQASDKQWIVTGSKGDSYTVTVSGSRWTCTCLAGQHGRQCKHVKEKQAEYKT